MGMIQQAKEQQSAPAQEQEVEQGSAAEPSAETPASVPGAAPADDAAVEPASPDQESVAPDDQGGDTGGLGNYGEGSPASPEEQKEYERAMGAMYTALYKNPQVGKAVIDHIQPTAKVDSTAKACILFYTQLDSKLNFDTSIIQEFTQDLVQNIIDFAERAKKLQYNEKEYQAILGSTYEGVLDLYGVSKEDAQEFLASRPPEEAQRAQQDYQTLVATAQGDQAEQTPTAPPAAASQPAAPAEPGAAPAAAPSAQPPEA